MFLQILKKDLKRKKTMNLILLIFIILAATFTASSANNLITISGALDNFLEKANMPDHWLALALNDDVKAFEEFAKKEGYDYHITRLIQIEPKDVTVDGKKMDYSKTVTVSSLGGINIFDKNNEKITKVNDGEIYIPNVIFESKENNYFEGCKISLKLGDTQKQFTLKGYTKDALYGSEMVGMTRFLLSDNDIKLYDTESASKLYSVEVYTKTDDFKDRLNKLSLNMVFYADGLMLKMMYFMDTLMAAILLIVSICLILISMVILRFIINFTISEEFREIGVMKAIGIKNRSIRGLYIVKYLAIAAIGTFIGLCVSFPFGSMMLSSVGKKIVLSGEENYLANIIAAVLAAAIVVLFSYYCTRKIKKFSPIDAIRSGETGERYKKKGFMRLGKSHLPTTPFMALNDIFSGIKSYISMIIIFILGTLLVIIPVNTINTLRSDNIITMFNMVKSDHVVSKELMFSRDLDNKAMIEDEFKNVRDMFDEKGIDVDIFEEIMFRSNLKKGDKLTNSLTFIGMGDITAAEYAYLEGTAPQNVNEVALTYLTASQIDAKIGDDVEIKVGETSKTYTVTALYQSMNNMGEGVRFYQKEDLDFSYAGGNFGLQIRYKDNPDSNALAQRKSMLENLYPDKKILTCGEYVGEMIGDVAGQLDSLKMLILSIILSINALVAVLMVKSFITKEKGEIAILKAVGFKNSSLTLWQTMRIGIVLLVSVIVGAAVSTPLSDIVITPIFQMMGAFSVEFEIRAVEVYLVFPLIMLAVTAFAAFISAQGLRKISASQMGNNE